MAIYLVRHGEDRASQAERFGDEGLTATGQRQAAELRESLHEVEFERCLCSPLVRAQETAQILLKDRDIPLELDPNLAEGSVGELVGLTRTQAVGRYPDDFRLGTTVVARIAAMGRTAPGGEPREVFLRRAERAAKRVETELERSQRPVLWVSHGGLLNYLLQIVMQLPLRDQVPFGFDYCGVVRLLRYEEAPGFGDFPMLSFQKP